VQGVKSVLDDNVGLGEEIKNGLKVEQPLSCQPHERVDRLIHNLELSIAIHGDFCIPNRAKRSRKQL
jgi:hypothetical protein